jgi:hypothetical protein
MSEVMDRLAEILTGKVALMRLSYEELEWIDRALFQYQLAVIVSDDTANRIDELRARIIARKHDLKEKG